jgi:hypothetical protein
VNAPAAGLGRWQNAFKARSGFLRIHANSRHATEGAAMVIQVVRLGTPRGTGEGTRIGTVRRPPRGVPKA